MVQFQFGFTLVQNRNRLNSCLHRRVREDFHLDLALLLASTADQIKAGTLEGEGNIGLGCVGVGAICVLNRVITLALNEQTAAVGKLRIVQIAVVVTIGLVSANSAIVLNLGLAVTICLGSPVGDGNPSTIAFFIAGGLKHAGSKVGFVVDDGCGDDGHLIGHVVGIAAISHLDNCEHLLNVVDNTGGLIAHHGLAIFRSSILLNREGAVSSLEVIRCVGVGKLVLQIHGVVIFAEADQGSGITGFDLILAVGNVDKDVLAVVNHHFVRSQLVQAFRGDLIVNNTEGNTALNIGRRDSGNHLCGLCFSCGRIADSQAARKRTGSGHNRITGSRIIQRIAYRENILGHNLCCLFFIFLIQIQFLIEGARDNDTVCPGDFITLAVTGLTLIIDQVEIICGGSAAPCNSRDGENLLGVVTVDVYILQIGFLVGVNQALGLFAFQGALQVSIEGQGDLLIGDVADIPKEGFHAVRGLGVGEVLGSDDNGAVGSRGHNVLFATADQIGVGLSTIRFESDGFNGGIDILAISILLAGTNQIIFLGFSLGPQFIGFDGNIWSKG